MNATAFLEHLQGDGFTLSVNQSRLRVAPVSSLTPELRAGIVAHKAALLRLLAAPKPAEPNAEQYAFWREQIMDGLRRLRDHDEAEFYALCEEVEERVVHGDLLPPKSKVCSGYSLRYQGRRRY